MRTDSSIVQGGIAWVRYGFRLAVRFDGNARHANCQSRPPLCARLECSTFHLYRVLCTPASLALPTRYVDGTKKEPLLHVLAAGACMLGAERR